MLAYDRMNPTTVANQWSAFLDEAVELGEAVRSRDAWEAWYELHDVVHSFLRLLITIVAAIPCFGSFLLPVLILLPAFGYQGPYLNDVRHIF